MTAAHIAAAALDRVEAANAAFDLAAASEGLDAYHAAASNFRPEQAGADLPLWANVALRYERLTAPIGETGCENTLALAVLSAVAGRG